MISTSTDIISELRGMRTELQNEFPLTRVALFGSWARHEQTEQSDIDILVEVDPSIGLRFVDLADHLEDRLQHSVDLVSRRAIQPSLWKLIEPELIDAWS